MMRAPVRLGVVLLGDRLVVAAIGRQSLDAFVVDAERPAEALRAELDRRHVATRRVALGLPRQSAIVKPIELPLVAGELREMLRFELERHLPFPADDAPFDFALLPPEARARAGAPPATARRVVIAAAERRTVDTALRVAEEARLRPVSLTVACHDLVALVTPPRGARVVWVHGLGERAEVVFLEGRRVTLSRTLPAGEGPALVDEIRRSLAVTRWPACDALWTSGDGLREPTALAGLGAPVTEPPWRRRAGERLATLPETGRGAAELAVAVAARRRGRPLDLLPPRLRPRRATRGQLATVVSALVTLGAGLAALLVPGHLEARRLADLNARVAALNAEVRAVEQSMAELERKRRLVDTIQSLDAEALRPLPVLRELTELLPAEAWLTALTLDARGVELTGQAGAASALIPLLENSPRLERVEFASPVTRGREREQFRIRAAWQAPAPAAGQTAPPPPQPAGRPRR